MSLFSAALTTIIANDLASAAASYASVSWEWCVDDDGSSLDAVEFVGTIPSGTPNTNNLRLVIRLEPDDPDDPTELDYTTVTSRFEIDYAPNLNSPTATVVKQLALPSPDDTTKATLASMADVLDYVHSLTDLFGP